MKTQIHVRLPSPITLYSSDDEVGIHVDIKPSEMMELTQEIVSQNDFIAEKSGAPQIKNALEKAYLYMLQTDGASKLRIENQDAFIAVRDALSLLDGYKDSREIQNEFESKAALIRHEKEQNNS